MAEVPLESTPGQRDPRALYEAYQKSNDLVHRRQLLRSILDCGPPADGAEIWLLLREIRALVAELCSVKEAERLLLDRAHKGGFPHYRGLVPDGNRLIDPRYWGNSSLSVHYPIDWEDSCVSYVRQEVNPHGFEADVEAAVLAKLQAYLPVEPFLMMRLVRLPLHDVLAMLLRQELLSPGGSPSTPSPIPISSVVTSLPSAGASSNPRPPEGAGKIALITWAYGELLPTNELTGLRGKVRREKVYLKIGPSFTASPRTFEKAIQRYREEPAK